MLMDAIVYGLILVDRDKDIVVARLKERHDVLFYGCEVIRNELRDTRRGGYQGNLRMDLLRLYDQIVKKNYAVDISVHELASSYSKASSDMGINPDKMLSDFLIVVCASLKNLDVLISNDTKSMAGAPVVAVYKIVNDIKKIRLPRFISYEQFKKEIT